MSGRGRGVLVAGGLLLALSVALPAAVASYRHGITVVARSGDVAMSRWLPWSTDGLLIAALVTVWVRRLTGRAVGAGPWAAYAAGMVAVVATNVAAAQLTVEGVLVAVWPPVVVAIVLELVALQLAPDRVEALTPAELEAVEAELEANDGQPGALVTETTPDGEQVDATPTRLYRLYGADGELLYVGITWAVVERFQTHRARKAWWSEVASVRLTTYRRRVDAVLAEQAAIAAERPRYNVSRGGCRSDPWTNDVPADYVPGAPVEDAEPLPVSALLTAGQTGGPTNDTALVEQVRRWAVTEGGMPSRERIRVRFGIGTARADRVRTAALTAGPGDELADAEQLAEVPG